MGIDIQNKKKEGETLIDWEKMSEEAEKLEKEVSKEKKALFEEIKKCPKCQETPTKVIVCDEHWEKLESLSKRFLRKQTELRLKLEMYPEETKKALLDALVHLEKLKEK